MKKWIDLKFDIGQVVYLKSDEDQKKRIVKSIWLLQSGIQYQLSSGTCESWHFDFELSDTIDVIIKTSEK